MQPMRVFRDTTARPIRIFINGEPAEAFEGESVGTALLASGHRALRTSRLGSLRGIFCAIGLCYECLVTVDGVSVRACVTAVRPDAVVEIPHA